MVSSPESEARCPICGVGLVVDISYDAETTESDALTQTADSAQLTRYGCGHVVEGASLASADTDQLDVEQRSSEETVGPDPE